jgi:hypothetical protein
MGGLSCRNFTFTAGEEAPEPDVQCPFAPNARTLLRICCFLAFSFKDQLPGSMVALLPFCIQNV